MKRGIPGPSRLRPPPARERGLSLAALREIAISTAPILKRELVGLLRTRRAFWMAVLIVGGTSLIPLLSWPEDGSPTPFLNAQAAFRVYQTAFFGALLVFVPAVTAASVTVEREQGTYELLLATKIGPAGIVWGKLLSASGFFLILLALTFPMVSILFLLGGFTATDFARSAAVLFTVTLLLGMIGLKASMTNRGTTTAVLKACATAPVLLPALWLLLYPDAPLLHFVVLVLVIVWIRLPRLIQSALLPEPPSHVSLSEMTLARAHAWRSPPPIRSWLNQKLLRRLGEEIPDGWNPVLVGLARRDLLKKDTTEVLFRVFTWVVSGSLVLALVSPRYGVAAGLVAILVGSLLVVPGIASTVLSGERELGNLDHLRTTPLTARDILRGALAGVLFEGLLFPIAGLVISAVFYPFLVFLEDPWWSLFPLLFFAALAAMVLVSATAGLLAGALSRTALQALVLGYLLSICLLVPLPLIVGPVMTLRGGLSPLVALIIASFPERISDHRAFLELFLLCLAASLVVAAVQYQASVLIFKRRWMRDR